MRSYIDGIKDILLSMSQLFLLFLIVLPLIAIFVGMRISENDYDAKLNGVGIRAIEKHYVEVDGVRSNWYEIVWKETKNEEQR